MSQQAYYGYDYPDEDVPRTSAAVIFMNWIGALTSISLIIGLGVWSFQLTMRDVSDVPVVRAIEGPLRIQPKDPGGELGTHKGLAVNSVQEGDASGDLADRVVLAPAPLRLSDEDVTIAEIRPLMRDGVLDGEPTNVSDVSASEDIDVEIDQRAAIEAAILEAVSEHGQDLSALAKLPGVKRSPRPKARLQVAALSEGVIRRDVADTADKYVDADPSEIVSGERLVQLGAFDDVEDAKSEWDALISKHGDLIGDRKRLIQEAESGGRRFYRLRMVGFETLSDSRRLCSALLARGTPCIPVTAR